jgi:hypothetical protein
MWGGVKVTVAPTALPLTAEQIRALRAAALSPSAALELTLALTAPASAAEAIQFFDIAIADCISLP